MDTTMAVAEVMPTRSVMDARRRARMEESVRNEKAAVREFRAAADEAMALHSGIANLYDKAIAAVDGPPAESRMNRMMLEHAVDALRVRAERVALHLSEGVMLAARAAKPRPAALTKVYAPDVCADSDPANVPSACDGADVVEIITAGTVNAWLLASSLDRLVDECHPLIDAGCAGSRAMEHRTRRLRIAWMDSIRFALDEVVCAARKRAAHRRAV